MRRTLLIVVMVSLLGVGQAGMQGDWSTPYLPALLPAFQGDMVEYAAAPRYTIDMTLTTTEQQADISGHQRVVYTNRLNDIALDTIVFRLYPNLESYGGQMAVSNVTVNETAVEPEQDDTGSVLTVPLPTPLNAGESATVDMDFSITIRADQLHLYGQFSYLDGVLALPNAYPVLSVYEVDGGWWDVTDHPHGDAVYSETAFYTVTITAPDDLILATSGSEIDMVANSDSTITHSYVAPLMRDFAIMGSTHFVSLSNIQDGVAVTMYYDPNLSEASANAQAGLQMAMDSVRIYDGTFGQYPFAELDFVQTPTTAGGIEYPGLIVVAESAWDRNDEFFEFVIVHEAAHQWWYSLVGNDQTLDPWMDEALAQYSTAIYIGAQEGNNGYDGAISSFDQLYQDYIAQHGDQVIGLPASGYLDDAAYFYLVYQKGPAFFGALATEYGYDTVQMMLRAYFEQYRYQIAEPEDMLDCFETTSGLDLNPIFDEWVGPMPVG
jgi:aminopeptidase N